jgi:hypothetical protein
MKASHSYSYLAAALLSCALASAQPFTSGSTGADGAYNATVSGLFDPNNLTATCPSCTTNNVVDASGDNIFNFTTFNVAANITVTMNNTLLRGKPVVLLATGNVTILGALVLDGGSGLNLSSYGADWITYRIPTVGGPGGSPGGVGARPGTAAFPGLGPGGAPVQTNGSCGGGGGASFGTQGSSTPASTIYGNIQTVPLLGGSGGSGGCVAPTISATDASGGTGGAGGGAIRIVSTTSITITSPGRISAIAGVGGSGRSGGTGGGSGSGGAINLIAPIITGNGVLTVGGAGGGSSGAGYILLNASTNTFTGSTGNGIITLRPLLAPPLPTAIIIPAVSIVSVNGVSVPQPPQGAFQTPDVTINAASAVTINIAAVGVPVGTVVSLGIQSELGSDQTITCNPLAGSLASSTATCSASFPTSVSRILASASW